MQAQDGLTEANMTPQIRIRQANRIGNSDRNKYKPGGIAEQRHRRGRLRDRLFCGFLDRSFRSWSFARRPAVRFVTLRILHGFDPPAEARLSALRPLTYRGRARLRNRFLKSRLFPMLRITCKH